MASRMRHISGSPVAASKISCRTLSTKASWYWQSKPAPPAPVGRVTAVVVGELLGDGDPLADLRFFSSLSRCISAQPAAAWGAMFM